MTITPDLVRLVRASRDRTVALTDQQVVDLTRAWIESWDTLAPEFEDALARLLSTADGAIPASVLARDQRLTQALTRSRQALDELEVYTGTRVTVDVGDAVLDAVNTRYTSLQSQLPPEAPGALLGRLDDEALDAIVARTTQQITSAAVGLSASAAAAVRAELIRGITVGSNPNVVARRMLRRTEGAFNGGLVRATRIARTEMLTAHRIADQDTALKNRNLITARIWLSTLDARTCSSCLAQHGTEWPVDAYGPEDHPQGRCVFVDKTKSWAELGFTGIEEPDMDLAAERDDWWENLTPEAQDRTLGKARADLLRNGDISWSDMSTLRRNPEWMDHYIETPLKDLQD
ncbi:phage minor head protein [Citricoccus sp. NR2]|uniref:phage minor head protein n=1 Tax=Citricoccus sp. NR2 TaxID=3004095 RepID=UPI0022DD3DCD|nr:phage minor head protein [Citricoccus sp. NR2]WBL18509.1 phage minor head protein [Citricoccus sp. NR2]